MFTNMVQLPSLIFASHGRTLNNSEVFHMSIRLMSRRKRVGSKSTEVSERFPLSERR